eukprot:6204091-Lingulodinium_polyedra.AAC.1
MARGHRALPRGGRDPHCLCGGRQDGAPPGLQIGHPGRGHRPRALASGPPRRRPRGHRSAALAAE